MQRQIKDNRTNMDQCWRQTARYINPDMNWNDEPDAAQKPEDTTSIYDTTAIKASNTLADGIQGYSFARNQAWFKAALEDIEDMTDDENAWLQYAEKIMYRQTQKSNFYDEGRSFVKCCADFGTAIMTREDDVIRRIPSYKTQHLKYCCIDENPYGEVDVLFRDFWIDAFRAASIFGEKNLPKNIKDAYGKGNLKLWKFTQAMLPVDRYDIDMERPQGKEYYTVYWADIDRETAIMDGYFQLKPFFCWRWSRNLDGGVWGTNSPGTMELADIKQANSVRSDLSRLEQQMGRPPIKATEGLNGRINLRPNGVTSIRAGEDFAFIQAVGNPQGMMDDLTRLQKSINEAYYTDFFLILSQNMEKQKTATEVAGIQGEKAALMSAFYGRLSAEFLEPMLEDLFSIELLSGRIPRPPDSLWSQDRQLRLDMISPLAMMQRRYLMLGNSQQAIMEIAALVKLNPQIIDNINFDQYARNVADAYGLDKRIVVDMADVERMRQARAQAQQQAMAQAQQLQGLEVGSKALANVAKVPPEMMQQAQGAIQ
ncbi:MAG: head-tail connector protein [Treponema sp.]|nr:head-tail connector protein [Treponema sp.]